ncbi:MAG: hypothetical protein ASARMPRED_008676 [Alectoria sarmentosa]|nr:MAG: hypothetical protein ASARMPRED_008676 [Alectoria sarmentosa]
MAPTSLSHPLFLIAITITLVSQTRLTPASPVAPIQHLPTANTTGAAARNNLQCINSADWATTTFMAYDCYTALALFEDYEVYRHATTIFEFVAANIVPAYPQFAQTTPRKYTYRSCTLAIVMLADLPSEPPGLPARRWPQTDLGDYVGIENAGLNVRDGCLSIVLGEGGAAGGEEEREQGGRVGFVNPTGYDTAGVNGAIGVFLWDTDSVINRAVQEKWSVGNANANATGLVDSSS